MRNLSFQVTEQQVAECFGAAGGALNSPPTFQDRIERSGVSVPCDFFCFLFTEVAEIRLLMGQDGRPRGMGVVTYAEPEWAARAVAQRSLPTHTPLDPSN